MSNIWEFLILTFTVSLAALIVLILKRILADKLSPRWQYYIWLMIGLRALLPVAVSGRYIIAPFPVLIETLKFSAERNLSSMYSAAFEPLSGPWFVPVINNAPASITDWIFIVYITGIIVFIAGSLISYIRLRLMLHRGTALSDDMEQMISEVCRKYSLKSCHAVEIQGLTSAFVCGLFKPVLVLPKGLVTDEKVILHELMHLKYKDVLQSVFWVLIRALHWCNPFMHYIYNQIGNDMEALCDQRVLERLNGEERRDYGHILLSMVNDKYPRTFGTSSISNGGKNIARRIQCIANFKKYPRGMALVSFCIGIMLLQPLFIGTPVYGLPISNAGASTNDSQNLYYNMASLRLNRCTTMAGAIDTFAKGLIAENGLYLAAASPLSAQEKLMDMMLASREDGWLYIHIENGLNGEPAQTHSALSTPFSNGNYSVFNLHQTHEDSSVHKGQLVIYLQYYRHTEEEIAAGQPVYYLCPETENFLPAAALYDIVIDTEGNSWVITDCSQPEIIIAESFHNATNEAIYRALDPAAVYCGKGLHGSVTAPLYTEFYVGQPEAAPQNTGFIFSGSTGFSTEPMTNAQFEKVDRNFLVTYNFAGTEEELHDIYYVTLENMLYEEAEDIPSETHRLNSTTGPAINSNSTGSSSDGWGYIAKTFENGQVWNGTITDRNVNKYVTFKSDFSYIFSSHDAESLPLPAALVSKCYMPDMETDFIISREVKN